MVVYARAHQKMWAALAYQTDACVVVSPFSGGGGGIQQVSQDCLTAVSVEIP